MINTDKELAAVHEVLIFYSQQVWVSVWQWQVRFGWICGDKEKHVSQVSWFSRLSAVCRTSLLPTSSPHILFQLSHTYMNVCIFIYVVFRIKTQSWRKSCFLVVWKRNDGYIITIPPPFKSVVRVSKFWGISVAFYFVSIAYYMWHKIVACYNILSLGSSKLLINAACRLVYYPLEAYRYFVSINLCRMRS